MVNNKQCILTDVNVHYIMNIVKRYFYITSCFIEKIV
nr:MAG TPA: hypothetical protein [Caudoviricetes sp.]